MKTSPDAWEYRQLLIPKTFNLADGTSERISDLVMERPLPDGGLEYRRPTADEVKIWRSFDNW